MLGLGISVWQASTIIGTGGAAGAGVAFIGLSNNDAPEDADIGDLVGSLSVVGGSGSYDFTLTDDAGGLFALDGVDDTRLEVAGAFNYEATTSYAIEVEADNGVDDPIVRGYTIFITNVLEVTLSALTLDDTDLAEGTPPDVIVGAVQSNSAGSTLSMFDTAGNRFALSGTNVVTGSVTTDFSVSSAHNITLRETHADGNNSPRDSVILITVFEPAGIALSADTVPEDAEIGDLVGMLSVTGGSGSYTFTITDDAGGLFALDGVDDTRLEVASFLDYETATSHTIEITADNGVDDPVVSEFTVHVTNVLDTILSALTLDASTIAEGSAAGIMVGAIQNKSPGSTLALTDTAGTRFALESGTNIVAGAVATDFSVAETHNITIRETHADASNSPRDSIIAISVTEISSGTPGHASGLLLILTKVA